MATIIFNGKTYNSAGEMPANERQAYEQMMNIFVDANGNGIPDFMEGDVVQKVMALYATKLGYDGNTLHSLEELPPDLRQSVDSAFQTMKKLGIIPDVPAELQMKNSQISREPVIQSKPFTPQGYPPAIQEGGGPNTLQWALAGIILFFCLMIAALGVFYFMR